MIKMLMAVVAICLSLSVNAAVIQLEWRFSEEGLVQGNVADDLDWLDLSVARLARYHPDLLPSTETTRDLVSSCYQDGKDWCNQPSRRQFAPEENNMAYPYAYHHYTIANWPVKNPPTPMAEPVAVLLLFVGFVLLFFRNLRNRMKARYVHHFPVAF